MKNYKNMIKYTSNQVLNNEGTNITNSHQE